MDWTREMKPHFLVSAFWNRTRGIRQGFWSRRSRWTLGMLLLASALLLTACFGGGGDSPVPYQSGRPVAFDLDDLDPEGRYTPSDGKPRHLTYEFCIPIRDDVMADVSATDATALCTEVSPGTGGCGKGEMLCVGNTRQSEFREVLHRLAAKPYIDEIRPAVSP